MGKTFGETLLALMRKSGLNQSQLADMAGLAVGTVSQYTRDEREPTWASVCKIADALGVDVGEFRQGKPRPQVRKVRVVVEVDGQSLMDATRNLPPTTAST